MAGNGFQLYHSNFKSKPITMIKVDKHKSIDRGADPNKEYYINQNGTYISLTKAELEKIASDLKLLGIADVIKSVCGNLHHFTDISHLGRCEECLQTRKP